MNDTLAKPPIGPVIASATDARGAPEGAPRLTGDFIRRALLNEIPLPPDSPLKLDARGARLEGVIVEGGLSLAGFVFDRPIAFERCTFEGSIDLSDATLARVSFAGSKAISVIAHATAVAGDFSLMGVRLENPGQDAFDGNGMRVGGAFRIDSGFFADGGVHLIDADIAGSLNCDRMKIRNVRPGPWHFSNRHAAFNCTRSSIGRDVLLHESSIEGTTAFAATRIGGNVLIFGTTMDAREGEVALNLANASIGGAMTLARAPRFEGALRLRGARAESIGDDGTFWADPITGAARKSSALELDQFHYGAFLDAPIAPTDTAWRTRLAWLKAQRKELWTTDFRSQPFTHLAEVLSKMGDPHGARMILFERERLRLKAKSVGLFERLGGHVMGMFAGYGYKNHFALYWAVGIWLVGALVFAVADRLGQMRPADPHVIAEEHYQKTLHPPKDYEPIKPALYSLDIILPIVELGQQEYWLPRDAGEHKADARAAFPRLHQSLVPAVSWLFSGWLPKAYYYFEIAMGWILVSIVIAGFSGLLGHAREE